MLDSLRAMLAVLATILATENMVQSAIWVNNTHADSTEVFTALSLPRVIMCTALSVLVLFLPKQERSNTYHRFCCMIPNSFFFCTAICRVKEANVW